ncbi:DegV family protein [Desulfosarcina sp.]|uniref:DegV family protein n=1 Tax=Desulfosarcina sp. TaxID=2027861 RepID=UPI003970BBEC
MDRTFSLALAAGCERVVAWADLLDEINVFPVADGDTGRNLKISLAPLGGANGGTCALSAALLQAATGNSGNIAAAFFSRFLSTARSGPLPLSLSTGRDAAWQSVADPRPGTMLTVFDALVQATAQWPAMISRAAVDAVVTHLDGAVRATAQLLPELKRAGVVDAGALGMFIFFEGFFCRLEREKADPVPVSERFAGLLEVAADVPGGQFAGYCVNAVIRSPESAHLTTVAAGLGESVVAVADGECLRLHLHTHNQEAARSQVEILGEIVDWQIESMETRAPGRFAAAEAGGVHIMTDAAGSIAREEARALGITLLDSYLLVDDQRVPESLYDARKLYSAMAAGRRVSTAQASVFQKHQSYQSVLGRYDRVLYLAVGSVYTGNFATANRWRESSPAAHRLTVIDTGAASGRLGLVSRLTARFARSGASLEAVAAYARQLIDSCDELIFLEQLKYLAAGGRISKSKGFFGDLLGIRPVIRPAADGAVKAGTVRQTVEQVPFALGRLKQQFTSGDRLAILLEYSDNEQRVRNAILPEIQLQFPRAQISVSRLSLTSGAHMGPGTWGVAFCPD